MGNESELHLIANGGSENLDLHLVLVNIITNDAFLQKFETRP